VQKQNRLANDRFDIHLKKRLHRRSRALTDVGSVFVVVAACCRKFDSTLH
jgi:hypothetical protein